jgi:trans-aconitate 2-methyltransferase
VGVDSSAALLAKARRYDALLQANIADWQPNEPVAGIFSNAALQWLGNHGGVLARLAGLLRPGCTLAVQMPGQSGAPSNQLIRQIAGVMFPDRFDFATYKPPVVSAAQYWATLG